MRAPRKMVASILIWEVGQSEEGCRSVCVTNGIKLKMALYKQLVSVSTPPVQTQLSQSKAGTTAYALKAFEQTDTFHVTPNKEMHETLCQLKDHLSISTKDVLISHVRQAGASMMLHNFETTVNSRSEKWKLVLQQMAEWFDKELYRRSRRPSVML